MAKYEVYLAAVVSTVIEVEADSGDEAVEIALEGDLPYAPGFADYEFGEWGTNSDLFPQWSKPEDDYRLVEEA